MAFNYLPFSKTFRKMINDCLKKESDKRPTAKQLLKHEFFKKAKVRLTTCLILLLILSVGIETGGGDSQCLRKGGIPCNLSH